MMNRGSLVKLCLAIAASCVTVAALEICARTVLPSAVSRLAMYRGAADVVYELVPGYRGHGPRGEEIRINAAGLRGRELGEKRTGTSRVLVVGDSFTFGLGVAEDESFPAALAGAFEAQDSARQGSPQPGLVGTAREAAAHRAAHRFEVLNAGVPGYNLFQERRLIEHRAAALGADAIVLVLIENDLYNLDGSDLVPAEDGTLVRRPNSFQPDVNVNPFAALSGPWLWLQLHSVAFREASFRAISARLWVRGDRELAARARSSEEANDLPSRLLRGDDDPDTQARFAGAASELRAAIGIARSRDVPLTVVLFPRPEQLYSERLRGGFARLSAIAMSAGGTVVDVSPALASEPDRVGLYLFPGDHHPSPRGYALAATATAPAVRATIRPDGAASGAQR